MRAGGRPRRQDQGPFSLARGKLAPACYLVAFPVVGTIAAWLLPETRGKDLDADVEA